MRILALGDFGHTGLAIALREPLRRLHKSGEHEILMLGIGYNGWSFFLDKNLYPFPVIPVYGHKFGEDCLVKAAKKFKPDIIWTCLDVQWIKYITNPEDPGVHISRESREYLSHKNRKFIHLGYFPVDGLCKDDKLPRGFDSVVKGMDVPVTYSKFTHSAVKKQLGIDVPMIYHGLDTKDYYPVDTREAKRRLHIPEDRFVVGMVATNQERKLFEDLICAFAKFCEDKPDASLMLFTNPRPNSFYGCHDLLDLMDQYGILNRYMDTTKLFMCKDEIMNYVYNAIDIGVLCTQGEGFGLPIIHHHAVGKPVLVTDCTSCTELTVHEVERVKPRCTLIGHNNNIIRYLTDIDDLANKLDIIYRNSALREEIGRMGLKRIREEFDYDRAIVPQWKVLLEEIKRVKPLEKIHFLNRLSFKPDRKPDIKEKKNLKFCLVSYLQTNGKWQEPENGIRGWCNAMNGDQYYIWNKKVDYSAYDIVMLNHYANDDMDKFIKWFRESFPNTFLFGLTEVTTEYIKNNEELARTYFKSLNSLDAVCVNKKDGMSYYKSNCNVPVYYVGIPAPVAHIKTYRKQDKSDFKNHILLPGKNQAFNYEASWEVFDRINQNGNYTKNYFENLSQRKFWKKASRNYIAIHLDKRETAGRFSVDCACLGISLISSNKIFAQVHCFPELSIDPDNLEKAVSLSERLHSDKKFYRDTIEYAFKQVEYFNLGNSGKRMKTVYYDLEERKKNEIFA